MEATYCAGELCRQTSTNVWQRLMRGILTNAQQMPPTLSV